MQQLFLFGNLAGNFAEVSRPFFAAAGGAGARVALLVSAARGWQPFLKYYVEPWASIGLTDVQVIAPEGDGKPSAETLERLAECSAIFMGGGDTRQYHSAWVESPARDLIRARHAAGVPYGGVSAGALLATGVSTIWGDRLRARANPLVLRGSEDGCEDELRVGPGLGLLNGCMTEAHFSELGGFPRLAAALEVGGEPVGLGFDDPICLEVQDGREVLVHGEGRAFRLTRNGYRRFGVEVFEPGDRFLLG